MMRDSLVSVADQTFFHEHGYWLGPKIFEQHELDELAAAQDAVIRCEYETGCPPYDIYWRPGDNPESIRKHDDTHLCSSVIRRIVTNPTIGKIAAQLLGAESIKLWHDQSLYKPASGKPAGNVAYHQDYNYWFCSDRPNMITAWIPMHDADVNIGTMLFVDGSHRWGWSPHFSFGFDTDLEKQRTVIERYMPPGAKFETAPCLMKAGHVSFHHCLTIHGSGPNFTDRPRRSMVVHLQAGDCRWSTGPDGQWHPCARQMEELGRHRGEHFEGVYWPELYRARETRDI